MENLRIHFKHRKQADWPLDAGVHRLVRGPGGTLEIGDVAQGALLAQFCADDRGLWLQVAGGTQGIHVNGRPVLRMALLRAGDAVYADGVEMLIQGVATRPAAAGQDLTREDGDDPRIVLRGVGGAWHGRSFPLSRACEVGSAPGADIRIEAPGYAAHHARLWRNGDQVVLVGLDGAEGIQVNGVAVREAVLSAGDQVAFGPQARFVVEIPWRTRAPAEAEAADEDGDGAVPLPRLQAAKRWPWLLLAALLLGVVLSALLLFGVG